MSLIKEQQRRSTLPLTIEQQLASFIEEQQGRSSFQRSRSIQQARDLNIDHTQASLTDQQQGTGRYQPFQATNNAPDRMPTIEQLLASLNGGLGSFQRTSPLQNSNATLDEQLASLIKEQQDRSGDFQDRRMMSIEQLFASLNDEQQRRYGSFQATSSLPNSTSIIEEQRAFSLERQQGYRDSSQDRIPTIEQQVAFLMQAGDFTNLSSRVTSNVLREHQPSPPSPEHLHLQPEIQAQAGGCNIGTANDSYLAACPIPSGVPREFPVPMPPPYGSQETFPGKLYCLLVEAEREGNDHIISFTPDGTAFKINDREAFIEVESPKHFRHTHITSFVRQLNFYGFKRQPKGPNRGGFAHPFFLRGHPELLVKIEKKDIRQGAKKAR